MEKNEYSKNNILLVGCGNNANEIKERISLLRASDNIKIVEYSNVAALIDSEHVNLIILLAENNNPEALMLLKQMQLLDSDVNTILIEKNCSSDFLIEMVDLRVDEIIHSYLEDWEFLSRIIWAIDRNTKKEILKTKNGILKNLNFFNGNGFLNEKYANEIINDKIKYSISYKFPACILGIIQKTNLADKEAIEKFEISLKCSLRQDDIILKSGENYYFAFLPQTKLSQGYSLFEKLKNTFGAKWDITAVIIDVYDEKAENIFERLKKELKKTEKTNGSFAIVLNSSQIGEENNITSLDFKQEKPKSEDDYELQNMENNEINEIFYSTFKKKNKLVIEPVFKKLKNLIDKEKTTEAFVDYSITKKCSTFKIISTHDEFYLNIQYDGSRKVSLSVTSINNNIMADIKPREIEVMDFSNETLSEYIEVAIQNIEL